MFPVTHKSASFCLGFVALWGIAALASPPPPPRRFGPPAMIITDITDTHTPAKRRRLLDS